MGKPLKTKLKLYRRNESNIWHDLRVKATHLKTFEYISHSRNESEQYNVGTSLTLRMDLRDPKKIYKRKTLFGLAFRQKQIVKCFYGNLFEYQFKNIITSIYSKRGCAYDNALFDAFECRLDILLFRSNFVKSVFMGRQWIQQGFVFLNDQRVFNFSTQVRLGAVISFSKDKHVEVEINILEKLLNGTFLMPPSSFVEVNYNNFEISTFDIININQLNFDNNRMKPLYNSV